MMTTKPNSRNSLALARPALEVDDNLVKSEDADANVKVVKTDKEEEESLLKYKMTLFALLIPLSLQLVILYKMNQFSVIKIHV